MRNSKFVLSLVVILVAACSLVAAQTERAGVAGNVTDAQGAVVPGATVKITNIDTGQTFETRTSDEGRYSSGTQFKPGRYKVEVSREGFRTAVAEVELQIADVREVSVELQPGAAGETVTVTSEAPQLETETSSRGDVIVGRQITELPLQDRNFTNLAVLTPGVTRAFVGVLADQSFFNQGDPNAGQVAGLGNERGSTEAARFSRSGGASISANGLRPTTNNYSLDGVDNNEPQFGTIGVFPNPDAIAEFKVETSVGKAEVGRGGATINTTFQSGTNEFHGSGYFYGMSSGLNATHPVIKRDRAALVRGGRTEAQAKTQLPKSSIHKSEFGGTIGGPVVKNRTFFFGDYLGQRNSTPHSFRTVVPTAKSRVGDFSEFPQIRDPITGAPIPGNDIRSRVNPNDPGYKLLNAYPLPNTNVTGAPGQGNENFVGVRQNEERIDSFDVKLDHRLTDNNNLSGRYSFSDQKRVRANFFPVIPTAGFGAGDEIGNTRQIVVTDNHAFRPTLLNDLRFGWTQIEIGINNCGVRGACGVSPTFCSDIGIPNCNKGTDATTGGILTGGFGNGFFEFTGDGGLFNVKSNNFYVGDSLTIVSGKHTWKLGVESRIRYLDTIDGGRSGGLKGALNYGDSKTGNAQASILLNVPAEQASSGTILGGANPFELRTTEWSFFVQDDWKVSPNLTLNLGLRYDIFPSWREANGRMSNFLLASNTIVKAAGENDRLIDTDYNNFGPRFGFAYRFGPDSRMVFRGGYGVFYALEGTDYPPLIRNSPFTSTVNFDEFAGNPGTFSLKTGPPVAPVQDPPVISPNQRYFSVDPSPSTSTIHEWNLTVQYQIATDWLLDIGYVGTRSRNLLATREIGNVGAGLGQSRAPAGSPGCPPAPAACIINDVIAYENRASSNYNALQMQLEKRFGGGWLGRANYTWSHNIDDQSGVFGNPGGVTFTGNGQPTPINPLDPSRDRSNSSLDRRHVFNINAIWDLPFGRGQRFGGNADGALNAIIGGWQANVIFNALSGQPYTITGDTGTSGDSVVNLVNPDVRAGAGPTRYLNAAAFAAPTAANAGLGTTCVRNQASKLICFGNTRRNQFYGPGYARTDFSLFKNTTITERWKLQLGIEAYNLFNHDNPVVPQARFGNGDFGEFRNALPPRQVQYRVKLLF